MKYFIYSVLVIILILGLVYVFNKPKQTNLSADQLEVTKEVGEANINIHDPHTGFSGNVDFVGKTATIFYNGQTTNYEIKDLLPAYNLDNADGLEYPCLIKATYADGTILDYLVIAHRENATQFKIVNAIVIGSDKQVEDIHKVSDKEIAVDTVWGEGNNQEAVILAYTFSNDKIIPGKDNIDISKPKPEKQVVVEDKKNDVEKQNSNNTQQSNENKNNSGTNGTVVLSFDDGPGAYTPNILEVLKNYGVKATFFMIGQNVQAHMDYVKMVSDAGHEIENHTFTHQDLAKMSYDTQLDEFNKTNSAIKNVLANTAIKWMRPPYGSYNDDTDKALSSIAMKKVLWNVDPRDWAGAPAGDIASAVLANVGDGSIVLMHDGVANSVETAKALPQIIEGIQAKGLKMVTLKEMKGN